MTDLPAWARERRRPRVVIVGGGFGGLYAARALKRDAVDVLLLDRTNHHLFQPLLYQVATATLAPTDITAPIRWLLRKQRNATVLMEEVAHIDTARRVYASYGFAPIDTPALEYLESVLPPDVRDVLWPLLADDQPRPPLALPRKEAITRLVEAHPSILLNLQQRARRVSPASQNQEDRTGR